MSVVVVVVVVVVVHPCQLIPMCSTSRSRFTYTIVKLTQYITLLSSLLHKYSNVLLRKNCTEHYLFRKYCTVHYSSVVHYLVRIYCAVLTSIDSTDVSKQ